MVEEAQVQDSPRRKKGRSPSYPAIDLEEAIHKAEVLRQNERLNFAPIEAVLKHWGFGSNSGSGLVNVSALIKFGLLEDRGSGKNRQVRLTDLAMRILLDEENSSDRLQALREAALNPPIHATLWQQYGADTPSTISLKFHLQRLNFLDKAAEDLIQEYLATIDFAKLAQSDNISGEVEDKEEEEQTLDLFSTLPTSFGGPEKHMERKAEGPRPESEMRIIQLPLFDGQWAALQASFPMAEDNWNAMMSVLEAMRPTLVKDSSRTKSTVSGSGRDNG